MIPRLFIIAAASVLFPVASSAASVSVDIRGANGKPLVGAVVTLEVPKAGPAQLHGPYAMEQRDIAFQPHILIVPVGATVGFPNRDNVRHHVYSFSKPKKIDLKLYGREELRSVVFDRPGVVALGCNIHDTMSGFIFVTTTPFAAQTDAAGHVQLTGVPPGAATVHVWNPAIRAPGNTVSRAIIVAPTGSATVLTIRP